jgi:hypothetical protein
MAAGQPELLSGSPQRNGVQVSPTPAPYQGPGVEAFGGAPIMPTNIRRPIEAAYALGTEAAHSFNGRPSLQLAIDPLRTHLDREPTDEERDQYEAGKDDELVRVGAK